MTIAEVRRRNLTRLCNQFPTQAAMAREIGVSPQALSQLLSGTKPAGEKVARAMEQKLRLAPGWLDRNGGDETGPGIAGLDDETIQVAQQIQALTPRDRTAVLKLVASLRAS